MSSNDMDVQNHACRIVYKELLERGLKIDEEGQLSNIPDTIVKITDMLTTCEDNASHFFRNVNAKNAASCLMDATVLKMAHELVFSTSDKVVNSEFRENEFLVGLIEILNSNEPEKLNEIAVGCCKMTHLQLAMLGTFDIMVPPREARVKKVRQTQKKDLGAKSAPKNIMQIVKKDKGAEKINIMYAEVARICKQRKTDRVPYFELIINPKSFMKSVDAAFQIAFLVRDGLLGLIRINDEPHVFLPDKDLQTQNTSRRDEATVQTVMSMNPQLWKEEIKKYKLKTPLLNLEGEKNLSHDDNDTDSD